MPTDQGCGLDNWKSRSAIKEARPENQPKPARVRQPPWPKFTLLAECQLFTKKEILGNQGSSRTETHANQTRSLARQPRKTPINDRNKLRKRIDPILTGSARALDKHRAVRLKSLCFQRADTFCGAQVCVNAAEGRS